MDIKEKIVKKLLDSTQNLLNKAYEKDGLTDEILEYQIRLNEYRNKLDICDDNEIVTKDGFVQ